MGVEVARDKWRDRKNAAVFKHQLDPIVRIAHSVLLHASKAETTAIRLEEDGRGVVIFHQVEGEWHQKTRVAPELWPMMRHWLLRRARQGEISVPRDSRRRDAAARI